MGWTALQFPWIDCPLKEEEMAVVNSRDVLKIEGMNMGVLSALSGGRASAIEHGYNPQTDYRKKTFFPVCT